MLSKAQFRHHDVDDSIQRSERGAKNVSCKVKKESTCNRNTVTKLVNNDPSIQARFLKYAKLTPIIVSFRVAGSSE